MIYSAALAFRGQYTLLHGGSKFNVLSSGWYTSLMDSRLLGLFVMTCSFLANNHLASPSPYSPLLGGASLFGPIHWSNLYQSRSLIPLMVSPPKVPLDPPNTPATSEVYS